MIRRAGWSVALTTACAAGALFFARSPLQAQSLRIQALDSAANTPLPYVLLEIRFASGELVLSAMTSNDGTRTVRLPRAGDYRILLRRVGFRAQTIGPVHVALGETFPLVFRVPRIPAVLPAVRVAEKEQCDITSRTDDEATRIVALWEQMQTAFKLNELAQADSFQSAQPMKVTGYVAHTSINDRTTFRHTVQLARSHESFAFGSFASDDITKNGYVRYEQNTALYIAPIEHVLLVNAFVVEHCFQLVAGTQSNSGLIGLAFKPTKARRVPEIAGTLWADRETGTPRYVEFWFLDNKIPEPARGPGKTGGEVFFGQLPNQTWATIGWRLRMPTTLNYSWNGERAFLTEAAGIATPVSDDSVSKTVVPQTPAYTSFAERFLPGAIAAQVINGDTQEPLKNATVRIRQYADSSATSFAPDDASPGLGTTVFAPKDTTVISNESGRILVDSLPPGVYEIRILPADRDRSPVQPADVDVVVTPHSSNSVRLVTAVSRVQLDRCAAHRSAASIYGVVRAGEGPVPPFSITTNSLISASWITAEGKKQERSVYANREGHYQLCDLPKGIDVTLTAVVQSPMSQRSRPDPKAPRAEMSLVLGEWQVAFVPLQIPSR